MTPESKLTARKKAWAKAGRLPVRDKADDQRLPPGQKQVQNWPVLDLGVQPEINMDSWRLRIDGSVDHPLIWTWQDFQNLSQSDIVGDMHCVTSWSRYDNHWRGVLPEVVVKLAKPKEDVAHVIMHSYDTYTTNIPINDFLADGVLLAAMWEGKPLAREHGGPLRLVVPQLYLWKSAKWIKRIEFVAQDRRGFWEERGYHNNADPWEEERYSSQETDS